MPRPGGGAAAREVILREWTRGSTSNPSARDSGFGLHREGRIGSERQITGVAEIHTRNRRSAALSAPHQPLPPNVRPVVHPIEANVPRGLIRPVDRAGQELAVTLSVLGIFCHE